MAQVKDLNTFLHLWFWSLLSISLTGGTFKTLVHGLSHQEMLVVSTFIFSHRFLSCHLTYSIQGFLCFVVFQIRRVCFPVALGLHCL